MTQLQANPNLLLSAPATGRGASPVTQPNTVGAPVQAQLDPASAAGPGQGGAATAAGVQSIMQQDQVQNAAPGQQLAMESGQPAPPQQQPPTPGQPQIPQPNPGWQPGQPNDLSATGLLYNPGEGPVTSQAPAMTVAGSALRDVPELSKLPEGSQIDYELLRTGSSARFRQKYGGSNVLKVSQTDSGAQHQRGVGSENPGCTASERTADTNTSKAARAEEQRKPKKLAAGQGLILNYVIGKTAAYFNAGYPTSGPMQVSAVGESGLACKTRPWSEFGEDAWPGPDDYASGKRKRPPMGRTKLAAGGPAALRGLGRAGIRLTGSRAGRAASQATGAGGVARPTGALGWLGFGPNQGNPGSAFVRRSATGAGLATGGKALGEAAGIDTPGTYTDAAALGATAGGFMPGSKPLSGAKQVFFPKTRPGNLRPITGAGMEATRRGGLGYGIGGAGDITVAATTDPIPPVTGDLDAAARMGLEGIGRGGRHTAPGTTNPNFREIGAHLGLLSGTITGGRGKAGPLRTAIGQYGMPVAAIEGGIRRFGDRQVLPAATETAMRDMGVRASNAVNKSIAGNPTVQDAATHMGYTQSEGGLAPGAQLVHDFSGAGDPERLNQRLGSVGWDDIQGFLKARGATSETLNQMREGIVTGAMEEQFGPEKMQLIREQIGKHVGKPPEEVTAEDFGTAGSELFSQVNAISKYVDPSTRTGQFLQWAMQNPTQLLLIGGAIVSAVVGIAMAFAGKGSGAAIGLLGALGLGAGAYFTRPETFKGLLNFGGDKQPASPGDPTAAAGADPASETPPGTPTQEEMAQAAEQAAEAAAGPGETELNVPTGSEAPPTEGAGTPIDVAAPAVTQQLSPEVVEQLIPEGVESGLLPAGSDIIWRTLPPNMKAHFVNTLNRMPDEQKLEYVQDFFRKVSEQATGGPQQPTGLRGLLNLRDMFQPGGVPRQQPLEPPLR